MKTRPQILMVEGDAQILDLARKTLTTDYDLVTASDSLGCVDLLLSERFDLLMIGLDLPVVNGVELIQMIRANSPFKRIPIIVLPSVPKMVRQLVAAQVQAIMPEPFSVDALTRVVADTIHPSNGHRSISASFDAQFSH